MWQAWSLLNPGEACSGAVRGEACSGWRVVWGVACPRFNLSGGHMGVHYTT